MDCSTPHCPRRAGAGSHDVSSRQNFLQSANRISIWLTPRYLQSSGLGIPFRAFGYCSVILSVFGLLSLPEDIYRGSPERSVSRGLSLLCVSDPYEGSRWSDSTGIHGPLSAVAYAKVARAQEYAPRVRRSSCGRGDYPLASPPSCQRGGPMA